MPLFTAQRIAQPSIPPDTVVSDADRQAHLTYEHWLNHENQYLSDQLKYYETEVHKLRKSRKVCVTFSMLDVKERNGN